MKFMEILNSIKTTGNYITEMIVHGNKKELGYIVSFRKDIYLFDDSNLDKVSQDILSNLFTVMPSLKDKFTNTKYFHGYEATDMFDELKSNIKDILCGIIENDIVYLFGSGVKHNPDSSELVMKITKQLKLKGWQYPDDINDDGYLFIKDKDILAKLPNIGYHATSSKYLSSILSIGLRTDQSEANWTKVKMNDNHRKLFSFQLIQLHLYFMLIMHLES